MDVALVAKNASNIDEIVEPERLAFFFTGQFQTSSDCMSLNYATQAFYLC